MTHVCTCRTDSKISKTVYEEKTLVYRILPDSSGLIAVKLAEKKRKCNTGSHILSLFGIYTGGAHENESHNFTLSHPQSQLSRNNLKGNCYYHHSRFYREDLLITKGVRFTLLCSPALSDWNAATRKVIKSGVGPKVGSRDEGKYPRSSRKYLRNMSKLQQCWECQATERCDFETIGSTENGNGYVFCWCRKK